MCLAELRTEGVQPVLLRRLSFLGRRKETEALRGKAPGLCHPKNWTDGNGTWKKRHDSAPCCEPGQKSFFIVLFSALDYLKVAQGIRGIAEKWICLLDSCLVWDQQCTPPGLSALGVSLHQQRSWPVWCNSLLNSSVILWREEGLVDYRMLSIPGQGFLVYYNDCRGGLIPITNCLFFFSEDASSW